MLRAVVPGIASVVLVAALSPVRARAETCRPAPKNKRVQLDLPFMDIQSLIDAWTGLTCQDFVVPRDLGKRTITMETHGNLTVREFEERARAALRAVGVELKPTQALRLVVTAREEPASDVQLQPGGLSDAELDAGLRCTSAGRCTMTRVLADRLLGDTAYLASAARFVPSVRDGQVLGFKLYSIRPGTFFARLGLQNGDTIVAVNGVSLTTPDKAFEVYTALKKQDRILIDLERRGAPTTIDVAIR